MIKKYRISIDRFAENYLKAPKRKTYRLRLYSVLLTPFRTLMDEFVALRDKYIVRANVTVERMSIEWYLNYLFDASQQRIYIQTNRSGGVIMGDRVDEPGTDLIMGDRDSDPNDFQIMTQRGEHPTIGYYRFAVFIPADLSSDTDAIRGVMDEYVLGGMDYTIIEF